MTKRLESGEDNHEANSPAASLGSSQTLSVLTESSVRHACQVLRHQYFVVKRGWVELNEDGSNCEIDRYDRYAHHISVFEGERPLAYVRALPHLSEVGFMLDAEFASTLSDEARNGLERDHSVELSRLVVAPDLQRLRIAHATHPVEHLLKALYHLALERGYTRFYIVVEEGWPQVFARRFGLPFQVMGDPYTFPDGTRTVAAVATLSELEKGMRRHSATKYDWYQKRPEEGNLLADD